ncbi:MAG TPA: chemotaxis-specific protein-glutamate methyltransferase CheB [Paucimonas sp.]|nr:chemotaxis-specific protein-glutamate methyltransferase CheB [Paucimonas sp.]
MPRVLVVDDSPTVRELLAYILGSDPELQIVGCAEDGEQAVAMALREKPDVITMDLHMPKLDGIEATRRIMQECPTPIVIVSGSIEFGEVEAGFRAIEAGALVIVRRPYGPGSIEHGTTAAALIRTVKSMAEVKVVRRWPAGGNRRAPVVEEVADVRPGSRKLVLIGASTGGPAALADILAELPAGYPLPIVIVQHMAPGFQAGFVQWLSSASDYPVRIAEQDDCLSGGRAHVAPDGFQIALTRDLRVSLARASPEHGMCPSVSHLFRSIHQDLCSSTIAVLLTGMGKDGALELKHLKERGAMTIVQNRATSAVYGMPGEALRQHAALHVLAPREIGKMLAVLGRTSVPPLQDSLTGDKQ